MRCCVEVRFRSSEESGCLGRQNCRGKSFLEKLERDSSAMVHMSYAQWACLPSTYRSKVRTFVCRGFYATSLVLKNGRNGLFAFHMRRMLWLKDFLKFD